MWGMPERYKNRKSLTPHQKLAIARLTQQVSLLLLGLTVFTIAVCGGLGSQIQLATNRGDFQAAIVCWSVLAFLLLLFVILFLVPVSKSIIREIAAIKDRRS